MSEGKKKRKRKMDFIPVIKLKAESARKFFLRSDSYTDLDFPDYFTFHELIKTAVSVYEKDKTFINYEELQTKKNNEKDKEININYILYTNKDGKYAWRPKSLTHPILYVDLVYKITEDKNWKKIQNKFKEYSKIPTIKCESIPGFSSKKKNKKAAQILNWRREIEQGSIELALDYKYVFSSDLSDFYPSILTTVI